MVLNYLLTGMILQVPSRERENISQGQNCRLEKPYAIYFWNCWIYESMKPSHLEKTKVSWFMPFCIIHIYIYIRYRVPKKTKLSRVATFLGSTLSVCSFFAVFSCYVVLKQPEPSPKVNANNRHTRIMILPTHTTALLQGEVRPFKKITHRFAARSLIPPKG